MSHKIRKKIDNEFTIPAGANIAKSNAVYINHGTTEVVSKKTGKSYRAHKKVCIGVAILDENGHRTDKMYGNDNYYRLFHIDFLPDPPERADSISVGPMLVTKFLAQNSGLTDCLNKTFSDQETNLILDLATYMLNTESAVFQHFPAWARRHALFSLSIRSDSYISRFLCSSLTVSKINSFKNDWAKLNIGSGNVFLCYDSINVNSQAEGVCLVQKGHAKDDNSLTQVNSDYVIRQEDGLPLTFSEFPGSIVDIAEASEMLCFIKNISNKEDVYIALVCNCGYMSKDNIDAMDKAKVDFLLMLKSNNLVKNTLIDDYASQIKNNYDCYMPEFDKFGACIESQLFKDNKNRYFYVIWSATLEYAHRTKLLNSIDKKFESLKKGIERNKLYTKEELSRIPEWFVIDTQADKLIQNKTMKVKDSQEMIKTFKITQVKKDSKVISKHLARCGFYILVSSQKITPSEACIAYSKRDCVEKVFRALKSSLGMDKIGASTEDTIHGKSLIWFVASILYSLAFIKTITLRKEGRNPKKYSVPAIMDEIDSIVADRNLRNSRYNRRYKITKIQRDIFSAYGIFCDDLDIAIEKL